MERIPGLDAYLTRGPEEKEHGKGCPLSEDAVCPNCEGMGYTVRMDHHASCRGDCEGLCPIATQERCGSCADAECICDDLARDAKADAAEARMEEERNG